MSLLMTEHEQFISDQSDKHISRLEDEIKALRKDAERYRWIRNRADCNDGLPVLVTIKDQLRAWSGDAADFLIDEGIKRDEGK